MEESEIICGLGFGCFFESLDVRYRDPPATLPLHTLHEAGHKSQVHFWNWQTDTLRSFPSELHHHTVFEDLGAQKYFLAVICQQNYKSRLLHQCCRSRPKTNPTQPEVNTAPLQHKPNISGHPPTHQEMWKG